MHLLQRSSCIVKKFYINYEECKFNNIRNSSSNRTSFILTMRNVNLLFKTHSKYVPSCFILTMENAIYIKSIFKLKIILLNL